MDRFNQSAGRNIGFRKSGAATHTLLANRRLYRWLNETQGICFARYNLLLHLTPVQREWIFAKN